MPALQTKVFEQPDQLGSEAWNRLVAASPTASVFQTFEWHKAWHNTLGAGIRSRIFCVYQNDELLGLAPLCEPTPGQWRFMCHDVSDYADFIVDESRSDVCPAVVKVLTSALGSGEQFVLQNFPQQSPSALAICEQLPFALITATTPCPVLEIAGREAEFEQVRRKKSLRRHLNYFRKQENYSVSHMGDAARIQPCLAEFFEQHSSRWQLRGQGSLFDRAACREFYQQLVTEFHGSDWLIFTVLRLGSRAVAFHLGFLFRDRFIWYKPSFDPELSKKSPGEALLAELFQLANDRGAKEFDFTVGDEPFKLRFANEVRHNRTVEVFSSRARFALRKGYLGIRNATKRSAVGRAVIRQMKQLLNKS